MWVLAILLALPASFYALRKFIQYRHQRAVCAVACLEAACLTSEKTIASHESSYLQRIRAARELELAELRRDELAADIGVSVRDCIAFANS